MAEFNNNKLCKFPDEANEVELRASCALTAFVLAGYVQGVHWMLKKRSQ